MGVVVNNTNNRNPDSSEDFLVGKSTFGKGKIFQESERVTPSLFMLRCMSGAQKYINKLRKHQC